MPAARGVKRAASKSSASTASTGPKNKKKRGAIQLEIPSAPKKRGRVLTCGQGDVGQLGLGEDVIEITKFNYVTALGDKIVDVYAGGMHTVALDSNGKVWTFGCNDEGALGRSTTGDGEEGSPRAVSLPARAVRLSAGDSHSAALLLNGDVYAWGAFRDSHGSMGLVVRGREGKPSRTPVKVDIGEQAVDIASGGDHLVILSSSGAVYTMGCGEQGQLGRLSQRSASRDARQGFSALLAPSKVSLKAGASRVWAGYHATFALDVSDKLFAWGLNNYGQLGITGEKRKTALYSPTECDAFNNINTRWQAIACGQHHTVALDEAGLVYTIGRCEYGRLGLGDRSGDAEVPEVVPKLNHSKCISIAAGTSNSFAVTDNGSVFGWGMGSEGQLGSGATDALSPRPATLPASHASPLAVAAGGQHTVLLIEEPTSQKEASPAPEEEDQPMETEEKETEQSRKRHKQEQDSDVSSTSSAQPADTPEDTKPPKVNGDEKKESAMDVDDTDAEKPTEKNESPDIDKSEAPEKTDDETEQSEPEETKPATDTSSQDTDNKSQDTPDTDTQNTPTDKLNGTPETEVIEPKTLESIQQPLTTTA